MAEKQANGIPGFAELREAPKVLLHDHLDGGMRPGTLAELAARVGYRGLPGSDPEELARLMQPPPGTGLETYLEIFSHVLGVTQHREGLYRMAAECAQDLAADGTAYAEVRFGPALHLREGMTLEQAVETALAGFRDGAGGLPIRIGTLLCALRTERNSEQIAEAAVRFRNRGVAGFDLAGAETGFPPAAHLPAFQIIRRGCQRLTIHAGEGHGLPSIREAVTECGAERIGHGVRIADDVGEDGRLGRLAAYVRDRQIPLELCPSSNVGTGAAASIARHPIDRLLKLGFAATMNTDNRLMSATSLTREFHLCAQAFGWTWREIAQLTGNAARAAFLPHDQKQDLIREIDDWYRPRLHP